VHRARTAEEAEDPDPRRFDERRGHQDGRADPPRLPQEIPDTTKIIIAQRIASVQDADRIVVMDDGRISGHRHHKELMKSNEIYREVYTSQNKAR
jgi:hypothetical protein